VRERACIPHAGEPMPVAVGEPYGERRRGGGGVGSARGRPQARRASASRREIVRVVCHEAERSRGGRREGEGDDRRRNELWRRRGKYGRGSYVSTYGKGCCGERDGIDGRAGEDRRILSRPLSAGWLGIKGVFI